MVKIETFLVKDTKYEKSIVEALIHGNMGAYYRELALLEKDKKKKNILLALSEHISGLECREKLLQNYPEKNDEINGLIATSYHCIGEDYFAMNEFESALKYHKKAEQLRYDLHQKRKDIGQKDKWIQSCSMICKVILSVEEVNGEDLHIYCDKFRVLNDFYKTQGDKKNLEEILRDFKQMYEKYDFNGLNMEDFVTESRKYG